MIITVTLNPAIDKTVTVEEFKTGKLNRVKDVRQDIGGKGINVSKVVKELGGETIAFGLLAGNSGKFIINKLDEIGIKHQFTWVDGETRTNLKLLDINSGQETEINEPGVKASKGELDKLKGKILEQVNDEDFVVLTGSLPLNTPKDIYAELITALKDKGSKVILDTSGMSLEEGLKAKPYLVKPNWHELQNLVGNDFESIKDIIKAGSRIHQQGIEIVAISLGSTGVIIIGEEGILKITPPKVEVQSTIGAGDTLVGALTLQLSRKKILKDAILYATAASVNSVTKPGTQLCNKNEINKLLDQVSIEEF
ncbi:MAG: 1-phosphofructokinase [Candidatus Frackibacter sp. T328-2]|nr:MAG: 1-phosphofructokinase [Candidatus Frackibacter sp. T328-2]